MSTRLAVRGPPRAVIAVIADIAAKVDAEAAEWAENRRMSHTGCSGNGRTCSASGGHFSTKSRRYSVTLGALRRARRRWHQITASNDGARLHLADLEAQLLADDDDETTLSSAPGNSPERAGPLTGTPSSPTPPPPEPANTPNTGRR